MAEVEEECTFYTKADQVKFVIRTNGDEIHIKNLFLSQGQATSLAWLVNAGEVRLKFEVKVEGD